MNIVLEGPDGAGKTELAKYLCQELGYSYHHEGLPSVPPEELFSYYTLLYLTSKDTVFDRFHLGERPYGRFIRNKSGLSDMQLGLLNDMIFTEGFGIMCLPNVDLCTKTWHKRNESNKEYVADRKIFKKIYDWYFNYWDSRYHYYAYDVNFDDDLLTEIKEATGIPLSCGLGVKTAECLIVGDKANSETIDLPFFSDNNSSLYIRSIVDGCKTPLFWTNAAKLDAHPRDLQEVVRHLPNLKGILALGYEARRATAKLGFKVCSVDHPAYWKRFKSTKKEEYATLVLSAIRECVQ